MNINKKIIGFLVFGIFLISFIFAFNSITALKKSQAESLKLFKDEFLELSRESFTNNSNLFFDNLDTQRNLKGNDQSGAQAILTLIKEGDPQGENVFVYDIDNKKYLENFNNPGLTGLFDENIINKYLEENKLNQQKDFDLDNFDQFSADTLQSVIPYKIHFRIYSDTGLVIGLGQKFLTVKERIQFIERQNTSLFTAQLNYLIAISTIIIVLALLLGIYFMRRVILSPLKKISIIVQMIANGDLTKKVDIKSKDEIGQLGIAFNKMSENIKEAHEILESKIEERTKELQAERGSLEQKVKERTSELEDLKNNLEKTVTERTKKLNDNLSDLEKINKLMVGRELKMAELKEEIKKLKGK